MTEQLRRGKLAAQTNIAKHGVDYYQRIGELGGKASGGKAGFHTRTKEEHLAASAKGGARLKSEETRAKMKAAWIIRKQRMAESK